jgi:DNA-binding CsgD family transcriptional regulator
VSVVVARDLELAAGDRFLAALRDGPASLRLEGAAGIGKTTIWAEIVRRAGALGHRVLVAKPARPEQELSLATLADLIGQVDRAEFSALPDPQRAAIDAVLFAPAASGQAIQPRLLGTAVRSLLERLAADGPTVVAIDDIQWTDSVSASVLGFALRRATTSPIGFLTARRTGEAMPEGLEGLDAERYDVGPMSVAGLHHVVRQELGETPSRPAMVRAHAAAGGNPLFALEIVRLLQTMGEPRPNQPIPVPGDVRELIGQRIRRLRPSVRESLLVASAVGQSGVELVAQVLGRDVTSDIEAAEDQALIAVDRGVVTFRHPLFGAAIYGHASVADRRRVHGRLASALAGTEEGARHGALAADRPDRAVADALEAAAIAAGHRGAPAAAADLLELAIGLTPAEDVEDRERRLIQRGNESARSGDTARAVAILEQVAAESASAGNRVRARLMLASIRYDLEGDPSGIFALCEAALAEPIEDIGLLALAHATYAAAAWTDEALLKLHASEALRLVDSIPDPDPATVGLAIMTKVEADVGDGRHPIPDPALVARALEAERRAARPAVSERFSAALGVFLKYADDYEGARPWLEQTLQTAIDEGDESGVPYALSHLPQLELWTGNWAAAEEYAQRHLDVAIDTGLEFQRSTAIYNLAIVHVHQGRVEEARNEIDPHLAQAEAEGNRSSLALLLATRCLLELSVGNLAAAARDGLRASEIRDSMRDVGARRHDSDVVEALVGLGDLEAAAKVLDALEERAGRGNLPTSQALAHRARAILESARGDTNAALASLNAALAEHERTLNPFDRARTRLVLGQVRRRRRERTLAREALEGALVELERLGAPLWAAKARTELDRLGLAHVRSADQLTKMERQVAGLAARGLTNKEVAASLSISPKTVEAHLARAYEKLDIASRAELGARLGAAPHESDPS